MYVLLYTRVFHQLFYYNISEGQNSEGLFNGSAYQRTPKNAALVKLNSKAEWKLFLEFLILF